jgi:hypothetical protein
MKHLIAVILLALSFSAQARVIASMPNQAGGKIVLTDEACVYQGKNYNALNKAYFYTTTGVTGNGCWGIESGSEVVTVVWHDTGDTKRYPAANFEIRK